MPNLHRDSSVTVLSPSSSSSPPWHSLVSKKSVSFDGVPIRLMAPPALSSSRLQELQDRCQTLQGWVLRSLTSEPPSGNVELRLRHRYADSTWGGRKTVAKLAGSAFGCPLETLFGTYPELATTAFLEGVEEKLNLDRIRLSTAKTYTYSFLGLVRSIPGVVDRDVQILRDYAAALVRQGSEVPTEIALPIDRLTVRRLLAQMDLPVDLRAGIFLAWKTASRWDDIFGLPLPLPYIAGKSQLLLSFLTNTKTSSSHPFEARFLALVDWSSPDGIRPSADVFSYLTTTWHPQTVASAWPTKRVENLLKDLRVPSDLARMKTLLPKQQFRNHFTAHSFKKGAIRVLWENSAAPHFLSPLIIERISKHKNPRGEPLSAEAIRYAPDLYPIALYLETHRASRLL